MKGIFKDFFTSSTLLKYFSLFITKNHQVTLEITLSLQVEKITKSHFKTPFSFEGKG
jgi:hypothetical protein